MANEDTVTIEDARLIFRNFTGAEGPFNRAGDRNFCVLLDQEIGGKLESDGWNVKTLKAREEGDEPQPYIPVAVSFGGRPPLVVMITPPENRTHLDEETVALLDWADLAVVDLVLRPYDWSVGGKSGRKAYLKTMFATVNQDDIERKYSIQE